MDREKLSIRLVRTRGKAVSVLLSPVVKLMSSRGVSLNSVNYDETEPDCNAFELYPQDGKQQKKPVLIYLHGGGWVQGSNRDRNHYCSRFAARGFYVLNMNYRLAPDSKHPEQVRDVFRAISYIYKIKDEYNLDMDNVFLGGDSAGAHLAVLAAGVVTNPRLFDEFKINFEYREQFKVKGLLLICGVFDYLSCKDSRKVWYLHLIPLYLKSYSGHDLGEVEDLEALCRTQEIMDMCPVTMVSKDYPPSLLITGDNDPLKPSTELFYEELVKKGVRVRIYRGTGIFSIHCFPLVDGNTNGKAAMKETLEFFDERLAATDKETEAEIETELAK
ncbi:MAG: alpha/beta hydrolase [Clostridiales bacterium]|jgi:acetyl esterase/lipase|nr:alpha/beta hydrolase [Clostridiales bacterium]